MPGPAPKKAAQRQRRNVTTTAAKLEAPPATKVDLPTIRWSSVRCEACKLPRWHHSRRHFEEHEIEPHDFDPQPIPWRDATTRWWNTIWASPMVGEWVDADVPGLLALAVLVDEFWTFGDSKIHAEIRMASREFGLSPLSRRSLQWEIQRVEAATPKAQPRPRRRGGRAVLSALQGGKAKTG
jgi:hypothetical protein